MARLNQKRVERERGMADLATRQHGVVARWQLVDLGFGEDAIGVLIASARLLPLHRGVFAVGHRRVSVREGWWAALIAYGPGAVLSHRSAAAVWGIAKQGRRPIDVTAPCGRQGHQRREGIWIHRCRLDAEDTARCDGFPVTTVARTLFDLGEVEGIERLRAAAEEADRLHRPWLAAMGSVCERSRGRRGLRPMRTFLAGLHAPDEGRTPLEQRFAAFCRAYQFPPPHTNITLLDHEVDAFWPAAGLVVELDSWEFHRHRAAFERDRARDPKFMLAGYRTIRVTHRRLDREAQALAAEIRALLAQTRTAPATGPRQL